ncbi:hypothetical protein [Microbacterium sp.]|uniref:hypothetical protein n=1 Tax=Microbacterium sp. TaxID=51671 RepID=UPI0039E55E5A
MLLALSACASTPVAGSSTATAGAASAAAATVTVTCEEFNASATLDAAYAAMGSVTGSTYTEANDHSLLAGAQNACSMDMSRTLNDVMIDLTGGQMAAAPSDDTDTSSGSAGKDAVAEECSFGSMEPTYTVEILTDFPDVWKANAPLPATDGHAVCHQNTPDTSQVDRYWVWFEDEQAGEAAALAWETALTNAGYAKSCDPLYDIVNARAEARTGNCGYVSASGQSAMIELNGSFGDGWILWFFPQN